MSGETAVIECGTSKGDFAMELNRSWSPMGYDRAVELFERGFYDGSHFFRVVPKFLVQFGITYSTSQDLKKFARNPIPQFNPFIPFEEGTISYAGSGDNSRTSQLFISYGNSKSLGTQKWETPIGKVVSGMENIRNLYSYGDMPPWGKGPVQGKIYSGRSYIEDNFPLTDKFHTCRVKRSSSENEVDKNGADNDTSESIEEWTTKPVKVNETSLKTGFREKLENKFQALRARVKETDTEYDLIVMAGIFSVVLLAMVIKFSVRNKKVNGKSS
jgi:peptidyl-prolyl cis-trans isomerase A (cyclophilin A)